MCLAAIKSIVVILACAVVGVSHSLFEEETLFAKEGDLMIAYVVHDTFSAWSAHRAQNMLTFEYTMEEYGKNVALPNNMTLGYVIALVNKEDDVYELTQLLQKYPQIVGMFGLSKSAAVTSMAPLLSSLRTPTFVVGSSVLSDYILQMYDWKYVIPMTATATSQVEKILPRIISAIGCDILTVICDATIYASTQFSELLMFLMPTGINIGRYIMINSTEIKSSYTYQERYATGYIEGVVDDIIRAAEENRTAVIVSLVHYHRIVLYIDDIIKTLKLHNDSVEYKVLILSSSQGCVLQINKTWAEHGVTIIRLCQTYYPLPELESHIREVNIMTPNEDGSTPSISSVLYSQADVACDNDTCSAFNELLMAREAIGRPFSSYNHRYYNSLRSFLNALQNCSTDFPDLLLDHASRTDGISQSSVSSTLMTIFKDISDKYEHGLEFDGHEMVPMVEISVILDDNTTLEWSELSDNKNTNEALNSYISNKTCGFRMKCSVDCVSGQRVSQTYDAQNSNCWTCVQCEGNTYSNTINATQCTECPDMTWTNMDRTNCSRTPTSIELLHHTYGNIVLAFLILAFILETVTFGFYVYFWSHETVIASGRDLSVFMFLGMLCGLVNAGLIASKPSPRMCTSIQVLAHVFIALILAPLFVRTLRICVVFNYSVTKGHLIKYVRGNFCVGHTILLCLPTLGALVIGLIVPEYRFIEHVTVEDYLSENMVINRSCKPDDFTLVYFIIAYAGTVLLATTLMGFQTRKIPDNFKESMHIFFCSLITLALVGSYVPAMILLPGEKQVFSLALIVGILSFTINAVIFTPKIYFCLQNPALVKKPSTRSTAAASRSSLQNDRGARDMSFRSSGRMENGTRSTDPPSTSRAV